MIQNVYLKKLIIYVQTFYYIIYLNYMLKLNFYLYFKK